MSNRKKVIDLINQSNDKALKDELEYFLELDREYDYDLADALDDAYTFAEESNDRKLVKAIRLILISAGFYIEAPEKTDVGRDTRCTVNKIKYECVSHWSGWVES